MSSERERLKSRLAFLEARAHIKRAVRQFFDDQGFLEVETPARVRNPGQELHLVAIPAGADRFLITSPEHHMKRLVAGGLSRIVQFCRCFRAEEEGPFHQPEFTMVEWYRAGGTMENLMRDCETIVEVAARAAGTWPIVPVPRERGEALSVASPFARVTVRDLLQKHTGLKVRGDETREQFRAMVRAVGCAVAADAAWEDIFFQLFLDRVEPNLGKTQPTFVYDWPVPLAALARRSPTDALTAERFELYAAGLELANAFGELTDPEEQRERFEAELQLRKAQGKTVYPLDEKLLSALKDMPPTCGIALGLDRLVMLVTGASHLDQVLTFTDREI